MLKRIFVCISRLFFRRFTYTVRFGLAQGLKRKGGLGFLPRFGSLTEEEKFLMSLDLEGQVVYDVGGYEGVFTLFFARAVGDKGCVVTFEPNPENYQKILENVGLNNFTNVHVKRIGLSDKAANVTLIFCPWEIGSGSAEEDIKAQIARRRGAKAIPIDVDTLDNQIAIDNLPKPNFVKIDVEGLELGVLLGMTRAIKDFKPALFVEMHGVDEESKIQKAQEVTGLLLRSGYSIYHVESGKRISSANAEIAKAGHIYCT